VVLLIELVRRWVPVLLISGLSMWAQLRLVRWLKARGWRRGVNIALACSFAFLIFSILLVDHGFAALFSPVFSDWTVAASLIWALFTLLLLPLTYTKPKVEFDPGRRRLLGTVRTAAIALPAVAGGYGMLLARSTIQLHEVELPVAGLPKDLVGLRIAQITDIHRGAFFSREEVERAVAMANELRPHLTVVTGDLISRRGDPLDDCIASLARLKAEAGMLGCHGNHEVYADCTEYATAEMAKIGIRMLRQESTALRFGTAALNVSGVDYQKMKSPYLAGCERLVLPGATNLLLSHNPDVFPVAAGMGFQATLAGHTHGGQINVEILSDNVNLARFFTPYTRGLYRKDGASLYVSAGLGTVGVPVRVGAPPEVTLVRLCAG
jgi:predicted MPP superfamily phosphohydrolase